MKEEQGAEVIKFDVGERAVENLLKGFLENPPLRMIVSARHQGEAEWNHYRASREEPAFVTLEDVGAASILHRTIGDFYDATMSSEEE